MQCLKLRDFNPINIRLSQLEIEYILNHAGTKALVFQHDFLPLVESMRVNLPLVEHYISMEGEQFPDWARDYEFLLADASPQAEVDLDSIDEDAVIELFYTSGTTGTPKVCPDHKSLAVYSYPDGYPRF